MLNALARLLGKPHRSDTPPDPTHVMPLPSIEPSASATLATFIEAAPDGIAIVDRDGTIVVGNEQLHRMLGYDVSALEGQPIEILVPEQMRTTHVASREAYQRTPRSRRMGSRLSLRARHANGTEVPVDIALGTITLGDRQMTLAFVRDASEQQTLWDELAAAKARVERELDARRQYRALTELLQTLRSRDEIRSVLSLHMERLFPQMSGSLFLIESSHERADTLVSWGGDLASETFSIDACAALRLGRVHESGGERRTACAHAVCGGQPALCVPLRADGETLGVFHLRPDAPEAADDSAHRLSVDERRRAADVADRLALPLANIQLRDRLLNQSVRDPLTGVFNRRHMDEAIAREISRASRLEYGLAVAMVDVDYYKRFNDTFGHDAGDKLLRSFAQFLASHLRVDDAVFRYGGEEFVLVLPGASAEAARQRIEALRGQWRSQAATQGWDVTFSAGIGEYPAHGLSPQEVLRAADGALYEAKAAGRDRVTIAGERGGRNGQ
ncbi:MAG: diguanylate cyclase [Vicinamibacterales bacterium]